MALNAGRLDRRIQIRRATETPDGYGGFDYAWSDHGTPISARRRDVSDSERAIAASWDNKLVTRFVVRANDFTRDIRRTDRIVHEGTTFEIDGIKEVPGTRAWIEITAETEEIA